MCMSLTNNAAGCFPRRPKTVRCRRFRSSLSSSSATSCLSQSRRFAILLHDVVKSQYDRVPAVKLWKKQYRRVASRWWDTMVLGWTRRQGGVKIRWLQLSGFNAATDQAYPVSFAWQLWGGQRALGGGVNWCGGCVWVVGVSSSWSIPSTGGLESVWFWALGCAPACDSLQPVSRGGISRAKAPSSRQLRGFSLYFFYPCDLAQESHNISSMKEGIFGLNCPAQLFLLSH